MRSWAGLQGPASQGEAAGQRAALGARCCLAAAAAGALPHSAPAAALHRHPTTIKRDCSSMCVKQMVTRQSL